MTLTALTSPLLSPLRHGFYTRLGGASSGIFEGLNCGQGSSDQANVVEINRSRVAEDMGGSLDTLVGVHQHHSSDVVTVSEQHEIKPKADAIVTATRGLILSILTADCQPVLFADAKAGVIGAAHAGWRGVVVAGVARGFEAPASPAAAAARRGRASGAAGAQVQLQEFEVSEAIL